MIDHQRSESARRARENVAAGNAAAAAYLSDVDEPDSQDLDPGDTLALFYMCCHPALTPTSALALTLRAVGGLSTVEIARALLVPEGNIGARISRAKQAIKKSGVPFALPDASERASRLDAILRVLYLIFNEGYASTSGRELCRVDLSDEAIRLTRVLRGHVGDDGKATGLLALMVLTDARRAARIGQDGGLIPLDEQDRSLWNRAAIQEGLALADAAIGQGPVGEYQLLAAIAAVHDEALNAAQTDWPQVLTLYEMLFHVSNNPIVKLNHAIAAAMVHGPAVGLALLSGIEGDKHIRSGHRLDAIRGHLHERCGDVALAVQFYRSAALKSSSLPERDYLLRKATKAAESIT
jgi:predicted RNA polymerase sigma factor